MKKITIVALFAILAVGLFADYTVIAEVEGYETQAVILTPGVYHIETEGLVEAYDNYAYCWGRGDITPDIFSGYSNPIACWVGTNPIFWSSVNFTITETTVGIFSGAVEIEGNCNILSSHAKLIRTCQISER